MGRRMISFSPDEELNKEIEYWIATLGHQKYDGNHVGMLGLLEREQAECPEIKKLISEVVNKNKVSRSTFLKSAIRYFIERLKEQAINDEIMAVSEEEVLETRALVEKTAPARKKLLQRFYEEEDAS